VRASDVGPDVPGEGRRDPAVLTYDASLPILP